MSEIDNRFCKDSIAVFAVISSFCLGGRALLSEQLLKDFEYAYSINGII